MKLSELGVHGLGLSQPEDGVGGEERPSQGDRAWGDDGAAVPTE